MAKCVDSRPITGNCSTCKHKAGPAAQLFNKNIFYPGKVYCSKFKKLMSPSVECLSYEPR